MRALEVAVARSAGVALLSPRKSPMQSLSRPSCLLSSSRRELAPLPRITEEPLLNPISNAVPEAGSLASRASLSATASEPPELGVFFSPEPHAPAEYHFTSDSDQDQILSAFLPPKNGRTALQIAAELGDESMVKHLLDRGADIEKQDKDGKTVLHITAERGNENITSLLLGASADTNVADCMGRTALFDAVEAGSVSVVQLLLSHLANVNVRDTSGLMPLHLAVRLGLEPVTLLLLSHGADINAL